MGALSVDLPNAATGVFRLLNVTIANAAGVTVIEPVPLAELPVPPLVELTAPVVLVYVPNAAPVTVTLNWH